MAMQREIIVNADDLESRVAIVENGQLAELHVEREARIVGSIYKARVVSVLPGMDAAFAEVGLERNVFLSADDVGFVSRNGVTVSPAPRRASISQRLKERQEIAVQIVRAPVGGKGARAGTRLAFPGRYLVLLAAHGTQVGVSRKIEDRKERDRLRKIGEKIRPEESNLILRTEAEGHTQQELEADLKVLLDLRDRVMKKAARTKAPALLHQDLTLVYQVIRDVFTEDVQRLVVDEKGVYDDAVELVKLIAPKLRRRISLYREKMPIFDKYGIEGEIDRLLRRKVWLAQGGYISIDQAEAFTAIDVNTGRYTGTTGLEDTIYRTNLEAAEEVARQLRLRDLGGIIVIDFIDMERARHRDRVVKVFEEALKRDRQRTKILHLSPLGLIEMTRKRRGESLMGILTETCSHCAGLGRVRRPLTVALKLERDAGRLAAEGKVGALVIRAAPAVAGTLVGDDGSRAAALEKRIGCPVYVRAGYGLEVEEHELVPTTRAEAQGLVKSYNKGQELTLDRLDAREPGGEQEVYGWAEGLRVLVDSTARIELGAVLVLDEAGQSFARAHVKGAQRKAEGRRRGRGSREGRPRDAAPAEMREVEAPPPEEREREPAPVEVREAEAAPKPSRRSRRGRRKPRSPEAPVAAAPQSQAQPAPVEVREAEAAPKPPRRSRRGRRKPRSPEAPAAAAPQSQAQPAPVEVREAEAAPKPPRRRRRGHRKPRQTGAAPAAAAPQSQAQPASADAEAAKQPRRRPRPSRRRRPKRAQPVEAQASAAPPAPAVQAAAEPAPPKRMGLLRRGARTIARVARGE